MAVSSWALVVVLSGILFESYLNRTGSQLTFQSGYDWLQSAPNEVSVRVPGPAPDLASDEAYTCSDPQYVVRILMYEPFIMHIENFITEAERSHLLALGAPLLQPSKVTYVNGSEAFDHVRTSHSAFLPTPDPVAQCVRSRAARIQGNVTNHWIEDLQVTAYSQGQKYEPHYDWYEEDSLRHQSGGQRVSTFFATLDADCDHCGTRFPSIQADWVNMDKIWCKFANCTDHQAVVIQAVPGAAVFWRNVDESGLGNRKTLHEGMPLARGTKTGLNIWTRGQR